MSRRELLVGGATAAAVLVAERSLPQPKDLTQLSIAAASSLMRSGRLSPLDLVRSYLERIGRLDGQLNSFITLTAEDALARAQIAEAELASGQWRGPLHGIPIALKDNIDTAGTRTTAASAVFAERVPTEDAEVVTRLKEAGAVILGKLNMHEFAYGATSAVSHYGAVRNPWDTSRISGGSSGGSAAAVAARLCAGALGTDTGGSVRIPSAHCGVVGLKPTYGLASIRGIIPLSVSLDHVGPICRTVGDAALLLQAIAGYDARDVPSINVEVPMYSTALERPTSDLRLGVPREPFYEGVNKEILEAVSAALDVLGKLTAAPQEVTLPPLSSASPILVEAFAYHSDYLEDRRALYDRITLDRIVRGANASATSYAEALYQLKLSRKAITDVFDEVDLLITPTVAELPVTVEEALEAYSEVTPLLVRNTFPFNSYGIPSVSIPCGFSSGGLPIGLQISGPPLGEIEVLALAHAYEQATLWHERQPQL